MTKTTELNYHISKGLNDFFEDLNFKLNHPKEHALVPLNHGNELLLY